MDYGLFDEASRDLEDEHQVRTAAIVRMEVAERLMPFLASASSVEEYQHRIALMDESVQDIARQASTTPELVVQAAHRMHSLLADPHQVTAGAASSVQCANCQHRSVDHTEGLACQCGCSDFTPQTRTEARRVEADHGGTPFS